MTFTCQMFPFIQIFYRKDRGYPNFPAIYATYPVE